MTKRNQLLRPVALSLLWLSIGLGCKKEDVKADCDPRQCCGNFKYTFIQELVGVRADIGLAAFWFEQPIEGRKGVAVCVNQIDFLDTYEKSYVVGDLNPAYRYKIWGKVYQNMEVWGIGPPYEKLEVHITRIERMK